MKGFAESISDTCQGDTIYSERGSRLEVQCDITVEFIAVFWFRGTDVDNGQLILRNDHHLKTVMLEGYNITDEGAMVINELQIEHEGPYWVRYLDNGANSHDRTISIHVKGNAVQEPRPVGMLVKGYKADSVDRQDIKFLKIGSELSLKCPNGELGEWGILYPNGKYDWLWRKYPEYEGGSCSDADICEVEEDGTLIVNTVTYRDEGHYMCFSRTGQFDMVMEYPVKVHGESTNRYQ
ncbi:hypothetical protein BSL78_12769 [Apostichopus japonicus]|uniref:Ig-like domain-containing protein n=1 Tax=Stichopus japonicus TaxID=307972 RepID=A0A2G8KQS2_STIJA|nr:hypothetical protein BSL78_12769 [Apostichopus japonicus]